MNGPLLAKKNNINISDQGRQFNKSDFDAFDYIYVMDNSNYTTVIELAENLEQKQKSNFLDELFPNEK
jgi:protein-tyrosine phosphatase